VLLQQGHPEEAIDAFRQALVESPRNGWALWGLLQAQITAGEKDAWQTEAAFNEAWLGDATLLRLDRL
jgi:hypothetical protein